MSRPIVLLAVALLTLALAACEPGDEADDETEDAAAADADAQDEDHDHEDGHDHADAVIWDGTATEDCSVAEPGTIVWELTEAEDAGYVELHIDEPEASVTSVDGPPHVWTSELYPLEDIEADADRIHGDIGDNAELLATYCPE